MRLSRICSAELSAGWSIVWAALLAVPMPTATRQADAAPPAWFAGFAEAHCLDCHNGDSAEAGLDLSSLAFDLDRPDNFQQWVLVHDRLRDGQMPPPHDGVPVTVAPIGWSSRAAEAEIDAAAGIPCGSDGSGESRGVLKLLARELRRADRARVARAGRATVRRLNRFEYENKLRAVLDAPWLQTADKLPEDGVDHLFNKVGIRLDVSHVQITRFLSAAEEALRLAVNAAAHPCETRRFYAREEPVMQNYLHYRFGQTAATRSIVPLVGMTPEPEIIRKRQPVTVGEADPEKREQEAMGVFSGTYSATTKYDFTRIAAPTDGRYRLRFKTYTFTAGPNGASGGDDHGLTGGRRAWWRPDRNVALPGRRSEPVTLYALAPSGDSRWLTTFDSHPEPTVFECEVTLRAGEGIRPDAARLVRTRPGWKGNPNATCEGVPGFAMNWLEVEGPLHDQWPPRSYSAVFADLPFHVTDALQVQAISNAPRRDARRLLTAIARRASGNTTITSPSIEPILSVFDRATELGQGFTEAMFAALSALFVSPEFLYFDEPPGPLSARAFQERLAYFLWNGPPDVPMATEHPAATRHDRNLGNSCKAIIERMLSDWRSDRFLHAFLDYWLDLRDINANTPDAGLYPDYYLDELLTESSVLETRAFFRELIDGNLPARNLVDSDFSMVNERLARHYDLPAVTGVKIRRVELPTDSPRGGLLTQASLLRVTANGTTTSPVVRGAWIMERILGLEIPAPPSGVAAVEPDIRGATTIREQLEQHRAHESCSSCHARFDPAGLALESFDVAGAWRERYRALGELGESVEGFGKNGHAFEFRLAQPVDCSGTLQDGQPFSDIRQLKKLLLSDERQIARNLVHRLIVFATGTPVSFGDRDEVERILDDAASSKYGVRDLIHGLVVSPLFQTR
jgi:hypothetical protein